MAVCQLLNYLKVPLYLDPYNLDEHNLERKSFFPFGTKKAFLWRKALDNVQVLSGHNLGPFFLGGPSSLESL